MFFVLLLVLGAAVCTGYETENLNYGEQFKIRLTYRAHTLTFFSDEDSDKTILWSRSNSEDTNKRGEKIGSYFIINKSTQRDNGRYELRDRSGSHVSQTIVSVIANTRTIERDVDGEFRFNFDLEQKSCNINYKPSDHYEWIGIVSNGKLQMDRHEYYCDLKLTRSCEIFTDKLKTSCSGYFEVYDDYDNIAWHLELNVEGESFDVKSIVFSTVIPGVIMACCCCLRRCCCKKSSSKKDKPSENEPVLLNRTDFNEHTETLYPARPNASTGPLIHNPPVNVPPAYSEVSAPAGPTHAPTVPPSYAPTVSVSFTPTVAPSYTPFVPDSFTPNVAPSSAPTVQLSYNPTGPPSHDPTVPVSFAPTFPSSSEFEPRYELKSFTLSSYSPLSSDTTEGGVYNSDKLNF